jgi:hypothetical protein
MKKIFSLLALFLLFGCAATVTQQGPKNGYGTQVWSNGQQYTGEWKDGKGHGKGTITFADGNSYTGELKNNFLDGTGRMDYADGSSYQGGWKEGVYYGQGTATFNDGVAYSGDFTHAPKISGAAFRKWVEANLSLKSDVEVEEVKKNQKKNLIAEAKDQCKDIGFSPESEKFADCVLKVMEMSLDDSSSVTTNSNQKQQELLDLQIEREKQFQREKKLDAMKNILKGLSGQSTGKIDLSCFHDCIRKGRMEGLCRKECSY